MKTTVDIPDGMLEEALTHSRSRTKREAILTAIREYNRRHRLARLRTLLGTLDSFVTADELRRMREEP